MRVTDYEKVNKLQSDDIFLLDSDTRGTRTIPVTDMERQLNKTIFNTSSGGIPVSLRRTLWRERKLGSIITREQRDNIANGTFEDIFVGDYWTLNGRTWKVVDFDTWWDCYDAKGNFIDEHHVVLMNQEPFTGYNFNDTDRSEGGWYESKMFNVHLQTILNIIKDDFGVTSIMFHPPSRDDGSNRQVQIDIPTSIMAFGVSINGYPNSDGFRDPMLFFPFYTNLIEYQNSLYDTLLLPYMRPLAITNLNPQWMQYCSVQDTHPLGFYCAYSGNRVRADRATSTSSYIKILMAITGN